MIIITRWGGAHCPPTLPYKNAAVHTNFSKLHHTLEVSSLLLARRMTMEDNSHSGGSSSKRACSSSSSKSSVASSSQISLLPDPSPKESMDEVWRDLSLSSPHPHSISGIHVHATPTTHTHHHTIPGTTLLQDFMARPSSTSATLSLPPPPTILFSLISPAIERPTPAFPSFNGLSASPSFPSFFMKKMTPENSDDKYSCDRRRKRLMKNRESAARSRARKQAYTNELELEIAHLIEENARLKRLQEKLFPEVAAQAPKKHSLSRTSTAPF